MSIKIQAIRGMNDVLPIQTHQWQFVEKTLQKILEQYGYIEIRTPLLEKAELFERSIGEVTDIVEKEMYTFTDRNGDRLTLRPEGTAGCVRAVIENGLLRNPALRLWYLGSMFRHERPQKGRYRQFHQLGVETFGFAGPDIDAELILMSARMLRAIGLSDIRLEINSLGTPEVRAQYREALTRYLFANQEALDEDSQRRLATNPLRILDSKNSAMQSVIAGAPRLIDYLSEIFRLHFETICAILSSANVAYVINPCLVRGLDYYSHTVFEWITTDLGAQGTVCAGGRFDQLVEQLGGPPTPATGFALGLERLVALLEDKQPFRHIPTMVYLVHALGVAPQDVLSLAEKLRDMIPTLNLKVHCGSESLKAQLRQADRQRARFALILGDSEISTASVTIKDLWNNTPQETFLQTALPAFLAERI